MKTTIRLIEKGDISAFRNTLDTVCREEIYLAFVKAPPLKEVEEFVLNNLSTGNPQYVAIDPSGQLIGWCDVRRDILPGREHVGHLGMGILPGFRGDGLGRRLIDATISASFEADITRIELDVYSTNLRAKSLYEKVGFQIEGIKREARMIKGEYVDSVIMGLLKNEFNSDIS